MAPTEEPAPALRELLEGNQRFVSGVMLHPRQTPDRRVALSTRQNPFAAIVGCSDSRVAPELIFDCGLGDLFVLRSAGHVLDNAGLGTVEYAVEHLCIGLVLVLGHSNCGAVAAALTGKHFPGHLDGLVAALRGAAVEAQFQPGDLQANTARANTLRTLRQLRSSNLALTGPGRAGQLQVAGAYYDLATGTVEMLRD
jgi:carbonic anhydrase